MNQPQPPQGPTQPSPNNPVQPNPVQTNPLQTNPVQTNPLQTNSVQPNQAQQPNPYQSSPVNPASPYSQQQPQAGFPMAPPADGFAITSMILGIIAVVSCYFGAIPGLIAVIFGHLALSKIKKNPQTIGGKGMAIAGLVTGYIGIAVTTFFAIAAAFAINSASPFAEEFQNQFEAELEKSRQEQIIPDQE